MKKLMSVCVLMVVAMGCAAAENQPGVDGDDALGEESVGTTSQALTMLTAPANTYCPGGATKPYAFVSWTSGGALNGPRVTSFTTTDITNAKLRASAYFRYVMGGPAVPSTYLDMPSDSTGAQRANFVAALCLMRHGLSNGSLTATLKGAVSGGVCGLPTDVFTVTGGTITNSASSGCTVPTAFKQQYYGGAADPQLGPIWSVINEKARAKAGWDWVNMDSPSYVRVMGCATCGDMDFDPGPATLGSVGTVTTSASNSAAATFDDGTGTSLGYAYPATAIACSARTPAAVGGEPCNTAATAAGQKLYGVVQRLGTNCKCVL